VYVAGLLASRGAVAAADTTTTINRTTTVAAADALAHPSRGVQKITKKNS
jgi:hypothetical protein